jgi:nucleotide sugar dehydrogenase
VTRRRLLPRLVAASGLAADAFHVAFSPERVSSGSILRDLERYPKLVGGIDKASGDAAVSFYEQVLDAEVRRMRDAETAEFAKLAESIYRDVNIALANELAMTADSLGIDYREAASGSNTQPYSHLHAPGVGVGGHCIPVYPYFLLEGGNQPLVALGRRVNDSMADYATQRLEQALREADGGELGGRTVLILGLAYRGGVKESAHSSTLLLAKALTAAGARVLVNDPLYSDAEIGARGLVPATLPPAEAVDAVVLQAAHPEYADLDYTKLKGCKVLLDGRRALERERVEAAGLRYIAIGLGE